MDIENIIRMDQERMERERSNFDTLFQATAELILPRSAIFTGSKYADGWAQFDQIYDPHGVDACDRGVSAFEGYVMPNGTRWQMLEPDDDELMKLPHVAAWYENKTKALFRYRNDPRGGYTAQTHESVTSLLGLGNQSIWTGIRRDITGMPVGIGYRSEHIGQIWIDRDFQGNVHRTHRKYTLTAEQAVMEWGEKLMPAVKVYEAAQDPKKKHNDFEFIQRIEPNRDFDPSRMDWRGKPWVGRTFSVADKAVFEIGGYRSPPRTYSSFQRSPNEKYGRGPGINLLPVLRECQQIMIDIMVAEEVNAMPPIALSSDAIDVMVRYGAGELTYGLIDEEGRQLYDTLMAGGSTQGAMAVLEMLHRVIDRGFFVDLLMSNEAPKTHITATDLLERKAEKGILLSPLGRQEGEWFSHQLDREVDCMDVLGEFEDMPGEVREAGGAKQVRYVNPLNRMMQAESAAGYFRTLEQLVPLFNLDPASLELFKREYPLEKVVPYIGAVNAVPAALRATTEEREAKEAEDAAMAQAQQMMQALPALAKSANDLAGAEAGMAGGSAV